MITKVKNLIKNKKNEKLVREIIEKFMQNKDNRGLACGIKENDWCLFLKRRIHRDYYQLVTEIAWEKGIISYGWEKLRNSIEYGKIIIG